MDDINRYFEILGLKPGASLAPAPNSEFRGHHTELSEFNMLSPEFYNVRQRKETKTMRKKIVAVGLSVVAVLMMTVYAEACSSNLDCGIGGKCIKSGYDMYGVCTNPYGASEKRGRDRYYEDDNPKGGSRSKAGKQCYTNMDCGIGGDCIKVNNSMYGTCTE